MKKKASLYIHNAIFSALLKFYNNNDIAKKVIEVLKDDLNVDYDVYKTNTDGFTFRRKKDDNITTGDIMHILAKSVRQLIKEDKDNFTDYVQDNYDIEFNMDDVNSDFSETIFDVTKNGRLLVIEFDM